MVTTFVLFLREGLEAALVIGMLLAALRQMGQTSQMRAVWIGAALAVVAALAGGIIVYSTIHEYEDTTFAAVFETITFLCAVVLLTAVTFWMQRHSRTLKHEIAAKAGGRGRAWRSACSRLRPLAARRWRRRYSPSPPRSRVMDCWWRWARCWACWRRLASVC